MYLYFYDSVKFAVFRCDVMSFSTNVSEEPAVSGFIFYSEDGHLYQSTILYGIAP